MGNIVFPHLQEWNNLVITQIKDSQSDVCLDQTKSKDVGLPVVLEESV